MSDDELLARIRIDPNLMTGKPVVAGTRLTVEHILRLLAHGASVEDIKREYPGLTDADVSACQLFAAQALSTTTFMPVYSESA